MKRYSYKELDELLEQAQKLGIKLFSSTTVKEVEILIRHRLKELVEKPLK